MVAEEDEAGAAVLAVVGVVREVVEAVEVLAEEVLAEDGKSLQFTAENTLTHVKIYTIGTSLISKSFDHNFPVTKSRL